jgi:hypothetical protein
MACLTQNTLILKSMQWVVVASMAMAAILMLIAEHVTGPGSEVR